MPRDERTYITVHDGMPDHPKVEGLSDAAFRLLVETWCWCSRNRTDGNVRASSWSKRGTARARAELLAEGLVEEAEDGVIVHDYTEHQRTAAEIDELKAKRRDAGSKGGKAKASAMASARANGKQPPSKPVAESETDTETDLKQRTSSVVALARTTSTTRAVGIPEGWTPSAALVQWSRDEGIPDEVCRRELPVFRDYWWGIRTKAQGKKSDWDAVWRNWVRRANNERPVANGKSREQQATDDMFSRAAARMGVTQ